MKPTRSQLQSEAAIDAPKTTGNITLHPATFGLLEWLRQRKNPVAVGGKVELRAVMELCFAFSIPSLELVRLSDAKLKERVEEFSHAMTPEIFHRIEVHAERELLKFRQTSTIPKKSPAGTTRKTKPTHAPRRP